MRGLQIEDIHDPKWIGKSIVSKHWSNQNKSVLLRYVGDRYLLALLEGRELPFAIGDYGHWFEKFDFVSLKAGDKIRQAGWEVGSTCP